MSRTLSFRLTEEMKSVLSWEARRWRENMVRKTCPSCHKQQDSELRGVGWRSFEVFISSCLGFTQEHNVLPTRPFHFLCAVPPSPLLSGCGQDGREEVRQDTTDGPSTEEYGEDAVSSIAEAAGPGDDGSPTSVCSEITSTSLTRCQQAFHLLRR
jgi:hypothetical protein